MSNKKLKTGATIIGIGIVIAMGIAYYMFNMPQRNVQETKTDFKIEATTLVTEYLTDAGAANTKYLADDGDSKVIAVTGTVISITEDLNQQKVVLLNGGDTEAGVSCTFTKETNTNANTIEAGHKVTIKGVIRSGASYDEDLEMYENVIIEKSDLILNYNL